MPGFLTHRILRYYMLAVLRCKVLRLASLVAQAVKNLPAKAGDPGSILGSGRFPGGGNGNPLQFKESDTTK